MSIRTTNTGVETVNSNESSKEKQLGDLKFSTSLVTDSETESGVGWDGGEGKMFII